MCRHQTLYYDDSVGYVIRCRECEHFQVGYGNVVVSMNAKDFTSFRCCVQSIREMQPVGERHTEEAKSIFVPTPSGNIRLLLTISELERLSEMLETADTEWKSQQLLDLFLSS